MVKNINISVNKSKIYFTPLFNNVVPLSYFHLLKNTYFWYDTFHDESFYLLYRFDGRVQGKPGSRRGFTMYERDILLGSELSTGYHDYGQYVIYGFELTEELLDYRNLMIEGKYSHLPDEAKEDIIEYNLNIYGMGEAMHIKKILYRDEELLRIKAESLGYPMIVNGRREDFPGDAELISVINPHKELFANSVILQREEDEDKILSIYDK